MQETAIRRRVPIIFPRIIAPAKLALSPFAITVWLIAGLFIAVLAGCSNAPSNSAQNVWMPSESAPSAPAPAANVAPAPAPMSAANAASEHLPALTGERKMEGAIVLARFSTPNDWESEQRESAARELKRRLDKGDLDADRAAYLLDEIAPGASVSERKMAATRLAELKSADKINFAEAGNELARLLTGNAVDADKRIGAALELAQGIDSGDLAPGRGLELMTTVAPEWSIKNRADAVGAIATYFKEGEWDDEKVHRFANDLYQAATGDALNYEKRAGAAVELAGEGIKRISDDYDDEDMDISVELIQQTISGEISVDSVSDLMNFGR